MRQTFLFVLVVFCIAANTSAQKDKKSSIEIYGFAMADLGYNANQIHPDWYDVVRPTKLPTFENQYGTDGNFFASVRQTRLGVKSNTPTALGELFTQFEFEMFGTGVDAGQTTIRLRHAYGQLGHFGAGQYWSPFMDIDVFPNTVEYWGPSGMAFFRNIQVRYMPIMGDTRLTLALERPGASSDAGIYAGRNELQGVVPKFPVPDFSMEYRYAGKKWGYVELAGIVRYMKWEDQNGDTLDLSGDAVGWGVNLSSNLKFGNHVVRLQGLYGEGIENYMNDAPVDVGIEKNPGNLTKPVIGVALPVYGIVAFVDFNWNKKFSTSIGYSRIEITNSDGQDSLAFKVGNYAVANLMYYPAANVMTGVELQWGNRENYLNNDFKSDIFKVQFSFKYNFSRVFSF